jgi:hypothetical protein
MKLLRRLLAYCFTPVYRSLCSHDDCLSQRQQHLLDDARERVRRTLL